MIGNKEKNPPTPVCIGRIKWVDAAKALGIFLVFWGHVLYSGSEVASIINRAIYSFHMPMFFILSGYVLKPDSKSFKEYLKNKVKRILLPALIVYIFTLPLYFYSLDYSTVTAYSIIVQVFYVIGTCAYNVPIWFFFCMFQVLMVSKLIDLSNASNKKIIIAAISFLILAFVLYALNWKYFNIFGFNKLVLGLFFYSFGIILKRFDFESHIKQIGLSAIPLWILTGVVLNAKCTMYGMVLGNFWLFIFSSISGTFAFFLLSKYFKDIDFVCDYARWTIFIVCSHCVFVTLVQELAHYLSIRGTYVFDIIGLFYVVLIMITYKYVCQFVEQKFPVLIGK